MNYRAYQVAPEYQQAPDFTGMLNDTIAITGNYDFRGFTMETFLHVQTALEYGENPIEENEAGFNEWEKLIDDYSQQLHPDEKTFCAAFGLLTGEKWAYTELRGCSQRDWQGCYYVASAWADDTLEALEMEYFNTGSEWRVEDENGDEIYIYCHGSNDDANRAEIASAINADISNVIMYKFAGWKRAPEYMEV